jgi:hypothetical protein
VLWTTVYLDAAVRQLKAQGYPVREEDLTWFPASACRLSGFGRAGGDGDIGAPELAVG